jgi:integrase
MKKPRDTKFQRGYVFKAAGRWYGRWREDVLEEGSDGSKAMVRRQHAEKLCDVSDEFRTKKDVQPLLDEKLKQVNAQRKSPAARKNIAESTLSVGEYWTECFWPYAQREFKPSTCNGYKTLWKMYLETRLTATTMRDFRCVTATKLLLAIYDEHKLGKCTLKHCKSLLSAIFRHAKQNGVLDGENPLRDAGIPRAASTGNPTYAYTPTEVTAFLDALSGMARTAIALMFFCALRPGEARAARWEDYNPKKRTLLIRSSMWRKYLTDPKTPESAAIQIVPEILADILAETQRNDGYILTSPLGKSIELYNLTTRVIVPALSRCAKCHEEKAEHAKKDHEFQPLPKWRGFYALRRGLGTLATSIDTQMGAKGLLRHSNIATTQQFYIKDVPEDAVRAVAKIDALFSKNAENSVPN